MFRLDQLKGRIALPALAGVCGAVLYIASPLSHQAFCTPFLGQPLAVAPVAVAPVENPNHD